MPHLAISLLGPLAVTLDGTPVTGFESARVRALLAFLASEAGCPHARDALAEMFWPEQPPGVALANLRHSLANLRKAIADATAQPPFLLVTQTTIQFNLAADTRVDLADFMFYLPKVASATPAACQAALALRRGAFLAGFSLKSSPQFEEWFAVMTEHVNHLAAQALACLVSDRLESGDFPQAIAWTRQQLALEPWNEEVHRQLIWQLAMSGQHAAALHHYETCRRMLANELGVEPLPATQALVDCIRRGEQPTLPGGPWHGPSQTTTVSSPGRDTVHLPLRPLTFLGRAAEIEQVTMCLADPDCRLLTVLGPGGMGKTLLAIEVAHRQREHFAGGVWFVDLAPVNTPDEIMIAILRSLALPPVGPEAATGRLVTHLAARPTLLVLDNFEHLIAGAALLPPLLHGALGLKLLVTSRARLHLAEEWLFPIGGLATPPGPVTGRNRNDGHSGGKTQSLADYASVQLFLQRARRLEPGLLQTPAGLEQIAEICQMLEGMPLAIDLAAAWVRSLTLAEIAVAVRSQLAIFTTTLHDISPRHRSMRAVFDHSWALLDAHDRYLLRQLAVFRGGCTRAAAAAIAGASPADLESLVDKSWLRVHKHRFELHELMRQYCTERLDQDHQAETGEAPDAVLRRHCTYFAGVASAEEQLINWEHQSMDVLSADFGNLEAAWRWAVAQADYAAIHQMMTGIYHIAVMTGWYGALLPFFEHAAGSVRRRWHLASADTPQRDKAARLLAHIVWVQADLYLCRGQLERARVSLDEMVELLATLEQDSQWQELQVWRRSVLAVYLSSIGDYALARAEYGALLAFLQKCDLVLWPWLPEIGSGFWQMHTHAGLGLVARLMGEYDTAQLHLIASIRLSEEMGERRFKAHRQRELAMVQSLRGDFDEALRTAQIALALSHSFGDRINSAFTELALGQIALETGRGEQARAHLDLSLAVARETGHHALHLRSLVVLARLERQAGQFAAARRWLEEATSALAQPGVTHSNYRAGVALEAGHLASEEHDWSLSRRCYAETLAALGCDAAEAQEARTGLAEVACAENDLAQAKQLLTAVIGDPATGAATRQRAQVLLRDWDLTVVPPDQVGATMEQSALRNGNVLL